MPPQPRKKTDLPLNRTRAITIVMVTHEPDVAAFCHRVIAFRDGRIQGSEA